MVQGRATAPSSFARGSGGLLCETCSSEGKEGGRDQDKGESWKTEGCRREEEEKMVGVPLTTSGWGTSRRCRFIGGHWGISGCGI